jgi:two-component system, NarL family, response regulator DevR
VEITQRMADVGSRFHLVLGSERPGVATWFATLSGRSSNGITTTTFDFSEIGRAHVTRAVMTASVVVIDASLDSTAALDICRRLRARREDLRFGVLFCCPHAVRSDSLRPFIDEGIGSFLDLQLSREQTIAALRSIARGEDVVRLQLSKDSSTKLFRGGTEDQLSTEDLTLMGLVALGLTDNEIGLQMCLSRHTIKHRIERLCRRQNARNRIQLAAVAGRLEGHRNGGPPPHQPAGSLGRAPARRTA